MSLRLAGSVGSSMSVWPMNQPLTSTSSDVPLFEHPAYGLPDEAHSLWNGRIRFAGTEAAPEHGGYLEGALEAAERAVPS